MKTILKFLFFALSPIYLLQAQVGIGTTTPNASLDIVSSNQAAPVKTDGLLIPKVDDFSASNPTATQQGMMVYLTTASGSNPPGYYYWDNTTTSWLAFADKNDDWKLTGNAGTTPGTNFMGTTDNQDLVFKTNNIESLRLTTRGQLYMNNSGSSVFMGYQSGNNDDFSANRNIGIGDQSLLDNTTGTGNVALGYRSLYNNINGDYNFAIGHQALYTNTSGNSNIAIGYASMYSIGAGTENIALGNSAMQLTTGGINNIAIGTQALKRGTGNSNIAIGAVVLNGNTSGYSNVAIGLQSMTGNTTGYNNVALGYEALQNNTHGRHNTGLGYRALQSTTTNHTLVGVGAYALQYGTGSSNTAIGFEAQKGSFTTNNTGTNNTSIGYQTLYSNTTGSYNIANGFQSLFNNTTGLRNIANGSRSLYSNTTGYDNTANGYQSLYSNTTGDSNAANGNYSLFSNTTGRFNTANGNQSLLNNTTGDYNTANGRQSLYSNTTGINNTANGHQSLYSNTTGRANIANGRQSLYSNTTGINNTANGYNSIFSNTTGDSNTANGYQSLYSNTTGVKNVALGYNAGYNETGSNNLYIENTNADADNALVYGDFGTDNTTTGNKLRVNGELQLGTTAGNRYFMPTARGTANQIIQTDASGQLSFIDPATIGDGVGAEKIDDLTDGKSDNDGTQNGSSVFLGVNAGLNDDQSDNRNVGIGFEALKANTTGEGNIANGYQSLTSNTIGFQNTANGYQSLNSNSVGRYNTANGYQSLLNNTTGDYNTANGRQSLYSNTTGHFNTAIGTISLYSNTTGRANTANGFQSLYSNTTGIYNTANGYQSLYSNTTGFNNTATGYNSIFSNTTGDSNTANGFQSLYSNTTGEGNIANGYQSLYSNTIGSYNIANGYESLYSNTTGDSNIANGYQSLYSNTTGEGNIANGYQSLYSNTTGSNNTANGKFSLYSNTTGYSNTANGYSSLYSNTTGSYNTANGGHSLYSNTTGRYNTANGNRSLRSNTTGSNNVALGYKAGYFETTSNNLYLENTDADADNALVYGNFGINNTTTGNILRVNGELQLGTTTGNRYFMPTARGTANQIMQIDGSGQLSFIDPATIGDGTGTDDQNLTGATLTGTSLQIDIENGSSTTVNLASLQDGTGTDDQTIDTFIFDSGTNIITLEVENDGVIPQTVNISSLKNQTATNGLTDTPTNIKLGGTLTENTTIVLPSANSLDFDLTGTGSFIIKDNGINVFQVMDDGRIEFPKTSTATAFENSGIIEIGNSLRLDNQNIITNTGVELLLQNGNNGDLWVDGDTFSVDASANSVGIGTQTPISKLDIFGQITIRGGNPLAGSVLTSDATGTATWETPTTGTVTSVIAGDGLVSSGTNDITLDVVATNGLTATANNIQLGGQLFVNTTLDVDANLNFDVTTGGFNIVSGGNNYFNVDSNGNIIADFNDNTFTVDPNTNRVGIGTNIPLAKLDVVGSFRSTSVQSLGGIQIGSLTGSGNRLVATSFDGQLEDVADGLANQILKTDGAGNYTWQTPTNGDITNVIAGDGLTGGGTTGDVTLNVVATNGLTDTADSIKLGGTLTENTTITQGTNKMTFNLNGTGDFNIQDSGTNKVTVNSNGDTVLGGDLYLRDENTSGTIIAKIIDSGNDGILDIYKGGAITNRFRGNGISYINGGSLGIGTTSPDTKLAVVGIISAAFETAETNKVELAHGGSNAYINVVGAGRLDFRHEGINGMSFTDTNRLGIGTTSPDEKLSVLGIANLNEDLTAAGIALKVSGDEAIWYNDTRFSWGNGGTSNTFADDVGIGMASVPSYRLDVRDNPAGDYVAQIYNTSTDANADGLKIRLGRTSPITSNNFIGFYDGSNNARGEITGNASGVQYNTTSDRRLKTNIVNITNALELLNKIQPRKYEFKTNLGVKEYGFIAQELQLFYPQAVTGNPDSNVETDPMMVDYSRLTPLLAAGIKELKEEVDTLKEENKELKTKLSKYESLEARLLALENANNSTKDLQNSTAEK